MAVASLKAIAEVTRIDGESLAAWSKQWQALDDMSKAQLREGVGNGSLTY